MHTQLDQIKPFTYTNPKGLKLEVLFVLDPAKKGYLNATAIAKQFGREPTHWLRNKNVQSYATSLIKRMNHQTANSQSGTIPVHYGDLVITINGGIPGQNGTWLHPKLVVIFARWLSPDFAAWCDDTVTELLYQHPRHKQPFPELSQIFVRMEEYHQQTTGDMEQRFRGLDERVSRNMGILQKETFALQQEVRALKQETKYTLGQIYNGVNQVSEILQQQQQADLLQVALPVTKSATETPSLITKIVTLRTEGQSWSAIARELNQNGTATASGKGSWYGSSVKKYYTANT